MDITQLKCFIAVAQTLSFTEAARRIGMTQPGISHPSATRKARRAALSPLQPQRGITAAGKEFHHASPSSRRRKGRFRVRGGGRGGPCVRLGGEHVDAIVSKCLSAFAPGYSRGHLLYVRLPDFLGEQTFDFHFALLDYIPAGNTFDYIVTHEDHLCVILPKDHPCADEPLDFNKLRNEPFITFDESEGPALYAQIMNICRHYDYSPRIINRYDRAEAASLSARAGISIIPKALCDVFYSDNVAIKPITGVDTRRTYVLAWRAPLKSPAAELFLETAKELFSPKESGKA